MLLLMILILVKSNIVVIYVTNWREWKVCTVHYSSHVILKISIKSVILTALDGCIFMWRVEESKDIADNSLCMKEQ